MRRELSEVIAPVSLRENLEDYLKVLRPSELDVPSDRRRLGKAPCTHSYVYLCPGNYYL